MTVRCSKVFSIISLLSVFICFSCFAEKKTSETSSFLNKHDYENHVIKEKLSKSVISSKLDSDKKNIAQEKLSDDHNQNKSLNSLGKTIIDEREEKVKMAKENYDSKNIRQEISKELEEFINNEVSVLLLPRDDVVLGKLINKNNVFHLDASSFIKKINKNIYYYKNLTKSENVKKNLEYLNSISKKKLTEKEARYQVFESLSRGDMVLLTNVIDNYGMDVFNFKDRYTKTILEISSDYGNYDLSRYMIFRGANIDRINIRGLNALEMSVFNNNIAHAWLYKKAGGRVYTNYLKNFDFNEFFQ